MHSDQAWFIMAIAGAALLSGCGNPGGMSDSDYKKFRELGAPKFLYSCTRVPMPDFGYQLECINKGGSAESCSSRAVRLAEKNKQVEVGMVAGVGADVTYNRLLQQKRLECETSANSLALWRAELEILESSK